MSPIVSRRIKPIFRKIRQKIFNKKYEKNIEKKCQPESKKVENFTIFDSLSQGE